VFGAVLVARDHSLVLIPGSYDHTAKLWDARAGAAVLTVDHGAPVESVLMFPSGGLFVTAGMAGVSIGLLRQ
jgi:U3 small nucleolar RNA-associated protein 15